MKGALLVGFVLLTAACSNKTFDSLCAATVPPPAGCDTACNPSGVANCPAGYHCSADGKCDLFCTAGGNECGDGYRCTGDGNCVKNSSSGPDGGTEIDAACPALHFIPKQTTPTVELLIDQSKSMDANYGPNGTPPTRWNAMRTALIDPTNGVVARLSSKVVFGATLYTSTSQRVNGVDVGRAPCPTLRFAHPRRINNLSAVQQLFQGQNPVDDTPTAESIDAIRADFAANPPADGSPKIIVLATDGLPDTCADADPQNAGTPAEAAARQAAINDITVRAAQNASDAGIKLFFLFVGNEQAGDHPQRMANAGVGLNPTTGRAPFYVATDATQLTDAFNTIIGGVVSCDLRLDSKLDPEDAPAGSVTIDGRTLTYMVDWILAPDGVTIRILGNACTMLKTATNPVVDAAFPCGSVIE